MRLISWNIDHPAKSNDIEAVIRTLRSANPDVVALQEVTRRIPQGFLEGLSRLGLEYKQAYTPSRGWGLLVASKWPLEPLEGAVIKIPKDEEDYYRGRHPSENGEPARLLSVLVNRPRGMFELHTVHVPPGSQSGWRKIDTIRAVARRMGEPSTFHRILCGDFNEPRAELSDGGVESWADHNRYSKKDPKRWQDAVDSIFVGLPQNGMRDIFRVVHGEQVRKLVSHRLKKSGAPRRYDHVFATETLVPESARYLPQEMWMGVSDHAPAEVQFME
jgi:endonuclease/exonuclease/phosphatase family metal-dependent hydrolase